MIRSVLLDLDGTLVRSNEAHAEAWRDALAERGKTPPFDEVRRAIGRGGDQLLPLFLTEAEIAEWGEALKERRGEIFAQNYLHRVEPIPGAREFVASLLERGLSVALGSSATSEELAMLARVGGLDDLPIAVTTSDDAERSKPEPDIWRAAMAKIGAEPATTAIVGDTPYDAEAATKAGLRAVGVLSGGWSRGELGDAGFVEVYADVAELNARLAESLIGEGDPA